MHHCKQMINLQYQILMKQLKILLLIILTTSLTDPYGLNAVGSLAPPCVDPSEMFRTLNGDIELLLNNRLMKHLFNISRKWPDPAIDNMHNIAYVRGHIIEAREAIVNFLERDHPVKIKVFDEIDALSEEEILNGAGICLTTSAIFDNDYLGLNSKFFANSLRRCLTLREALIYPAVDAADLLRILLEGINQLIVALAESSSELHKKFIENQIKAHYLIVRAIEILSRKSDMVILQQQDLDNLAENILLHGKMFIERISGHLLHLTGLIMPADTPQRQKSLKNIIVLFDRLQERDALWEEFLARADKQAEIQRLRAAYQFPAEVLSALTRAPISRQSSALSSAEKVRDILLEWRNRPEPSELKTFSLQDIKEGAVLASKIDSRLAFDISLFNNSAVFLELKSCLPFVYDMVVEILDIFFHDYDKILIAGRDADVFYDALRIVLAGTPYENEVLLFPASRAFIEYLTESDDISLIVKFLAEFGITPEAIKEQKRFLIIDTGFSTKLEDNLRLLVRKVYESKIDNVHLDGVIDIKLVSTGNSYKYFKYRLRQFNIDLSRLERMFPGTMVRLQKEHYGVDNIKHPDTRSNILLAVALELLPRYHEPHLMLTANKDGFPIAIPRRRRKIAENIDDKHVREDSIVNPVAAMLVQYKVIEYFQKRRQEIITNPFLDATSRREKLILSASAAETLQSL